MNQNIFDVVRGDPKYSTTNSWSWFMRNVRDLATAQGVKPLALMGDNQIHQTDKILPGYFYQFFYDPKYKEELPFYDTFPLAIPFSATATHFTGLNMHMIYPRARLLLLSKLLVFASDDKLSEKMKINLSWKFISNASRFPGVDKCVRMYLKSHVKSKFLKIPPVDYFSAIFLPVESMKKMTVQEVWKKNSRY